MIYSLNETTALLLKAARGAGMSWGYAQEAAFATLWLEQRQIEGTEALCTVLRTRGRHNSQSGSLLADSGPISVGCRLTDLMPDLGEEALYEAIVAPVLTLPYIHQYAGLKNIALKVTGDGWTAWSDGTHFTFEGTPSHHRQDLTLSRIDHPVTDGAALIPRIALRPDHLRDLNHYAHRTYAPATEASRLAGAGAGLNDND